MLSCLALPFGNNNENYGNKKKIMIKKKTITIINKGNVVCLRFTIAMALITYDMDTIYLPILLYTKLTNNSGFNAF